MTDQTNIDNTSGSNVNTTVNVDDLQNKIDSAVQQRLAREKAQTKLLQEQWDAERQALVAENELLKKEFQTKLDQELSDIPTSFRSLVSKLPVVEQIAWLEEQEKEKEKLPKPITIPNFNKKSNEEKGEIKHIAPDRIA